ncbi:MAG: hypothetical protein QXW39_09525 [Candidatus Bathyarchaeia archaeon]
MSIEFLFILITLGYIIGFSLAIISILRGIIQRIPELFDSLIQDEIQRIINNKEIFDQIKQYIADLGQGALSKISPKQSFKFQDLIGFALQHFFMPKEKPPEQPQKSLPRNPFQKT